MVRYPVPPMPNDRPYSVPRAETEPLRKDYTRWAYLGIIVLIVILVLVFFGWMFLA